MEANLVLVFDFRILEGLLGDEVLDEDRVGHSSSPIFFSRVLFLYFFGLEEGRGDDKEEEENEV